MSAIDDLVTYNGGLTEEEHGDAVKELATLRANQLSPAIVAAVRAYQEAFLEHRKASVLVLGGTRDVSIAWDNLQIAIEADAKERG